MYGIIRSAASWAFRLGVVLPVGVMALVALYLISPVGILFALVFCDSAEDFRDEIRTTYVDLPVSFFREAVFDR